MSFTNCHKRTAQFTVLCHILPIINAFKTDVPLNYKQVHKNMFYFTENT